MPTLRPGGRRRREAVGLNLSLQKTLAPRARVGHSTSVARGHTRGRALGALILLLTASLLAGCPSPTGTDVSPAEESGPELPPPPPYDPATDQLAAASLGHVLPVTPDGGFRGVLSTDGTHLIGHFHNGTFPNEYALFSLDTTTWASVAVPTESLAAVHSAVVVDGVVYLGGPATTVAWGAAGSAPTERRSVRLDYKPPGGSPIVSVFLTRPEGMYLGTDYGVFRSADLGATKPAASLIRAAGGAVESYTVDTAAFHVSADHLLVAAREKGHRSGTDSGVIAWDPVLEAWTRMDGLPLDDANDVAAIGSRIYAATSAGLAVAADPAGGFTPIDLDGDDHTAEPEGLDLFAHNGVVYAGTSDGLWYSSDGGAAWTRFDIESALPPGPASIAVRSVAVLENRVFLAVDGFGVLELRWE